MSAECNTPYFRFPHLYTRGVSQHWAIQDIHQTGFRHRRSTKTRQMFGNTAAAGDQVRSPLFIRDLPSSFSYFDVFIPHTTLLTEEVGSNIFMETCFAPSQIYNDFTHMLIGPTYF